VWALNIFNAVNYTVVATLFHSDLIVGSQPSDQTKFWFRLFIMPLSWTVNFITALAFLFLFMNQGTKALLKERTVSRVNIGDLAKRSLVL
jgi:hypothetical protein